MATIHKNLSVIEGALPSASGMKFGIVVSEWNTQVTAALLDGAMRHNVQVLLSDSGKRSGNPILRSNAYRVRSS